MNMFELFEQQHQFLEDTLERAEKQSQFLKEMSDIIDTLLQLKLDQAITCKKTTREKVLVQWKKFVYLSLEGKRLGMSNNPFFYEQGRNVIKAFKQFQDVVPELKNLR